MNEPISKEQALNSLKKFAEEGKLDTSEVLTLIAISLASKDYELSQWKGKTYFNHPELEEL